MASSATSGARRSIGGHRRDRVDASGNRCSGRPTAAPRGVRRRSACRTEAGPERAGVEPGQRRLDELELLVGAVAQGEVALLGEDLAGRGGLRPVGHLAGRDDRLAELRERGGRARPSSAARTRPRSMASIERMVRRAGHARRRDSLYSRGVHQRRTSWPSRSIPSAAWRSTPRPRQLSLSTTGTTYWFCGKGCLLEFKDDPEKYLAAGPRAVDVARGRWRR